MNPITVITGTRKGIGRYLCEYYLDKGHTVVGCSRDESDLLHERYEHFCLDVSDEKAVCKMIAAVARKHRKIDNLINNAGIASMNHCLLTPAKTIESVFRTNYLGTFIFCREVAKVMVHAKFGRIVNFATVATPLDLEGESAYAASKAAVESLTRVMARELANYNITVNAVGPTPVMTDLIRTVPKAKMEALLARQAIPRFGTFEDISNVIDFMISPDSSFITGQVLFLGGVS